MTGAGAFQWTVEASDVGHLVGRMFDGSRDGVLVVISPASDTHRPRIEPHELSAMLPPGSEIAVLASMDASVKLSALVDPAFQCYGGGVRVVLPNAARSDHWRRHRLFTIYPGDDLRQACHRIAAFAEEASWSGATVTVGSAQSARSISEQQAAALARFSERLATTPKPAVGLAPAPRISDDESHQAQTVEPAPTLLPADDLEPEEPRETVDIDAPAAQAETSSIALEDLSILLDAQTGAIVDALRRVVDDDVLSVLDLQGSAARQRSRADAVEQELAELQRRYEELLERDRDVPLVYGDVETQFRWEVEYWWLTETPETERATFRGYALGSSFLESLDAQIVPRHKAIQVVVDVLTRQVWERRKCHQLNDAARGGTQRIRPDGAGAWRAYVKAESPGAPRLTWWELPDGTVEFEHVGHHDQGL